MKVLRLFGFLFVLLLLGLLVVPLIIPIPPLEESVPIEDLADSDSQFIEVNSIRVHYKTYGSGEPVMILLHGFASSTYSWVDVAPALAEIGTVVAYDRPAFGLTERLMPGEWTGDNPYTIQSQVKLLTGLMDALTIDQAVLVGHSAGAVIALQTALDHPERVSGLVLVDPAISDRSAMPAWVRPVLDTPQMKRIGPWISRTLDSDQGDAFLEMAWYDPSKFTPEDVEGYRKPLRVANWDVALWEFTLASGGIDLETRLNEVIQPVLVISGDNDRIIPPEDSKILADALSDARYAEVQACGHVPQEECPEGFLPPVLAFLSQFQK